MSPEEKALSSVKSGVSNPKNSFLFSESSLGFRREEYIDTLYLNVTQGMTAEHEGQAGA